MGKLYSSGLTHLSLGSPSRFLSFRFYARVFSSILFVHFLFSLFFPSSFLSFSCTLPSSSSLLFLPSLPPLILLLVC